MSITRRTFLGAASWLSCTAMAQNLEPIDFRPAVIEARNNIGGWFLTMYKDAEGRLEPVNAISAMGAVSGAFAHRQALAMIANRTLPADRTSYLKVEARDGQIYWLGDSINWVVYEGRGADPRALSLFGLVAPSAGVPDPDTAIDFPEIFRNAVATFGTPAFGAPRNGVTPRPTETMMAALKAHVPILKARLRELGVRDTELVAAFGAAAQGFVPICAGQRNTPLTQEIDSLKTVQLFFEAAIPASKLDPPVTGA